MTREDDSKIATCKSCGAEIVWMKTKKDKNICVDLPDPDDPLREEVLEAELFDRDRFTTHFETCPNADSHRKARGGASAPPPAAGENNLNARRLNTALAALEDVRKRTTEPGVKQIVEAALSQVRAIK